MLPDNEEVRLISIPVIDRVRLPPPRAASIDALWSRQQGGGEHCKPPALPHIGSIYRRNHRDGRDAARNGGPPAGERLRDPRNRVSGAADSHRRVCPAFSRGVWEIPETADRADMDPGVIYWIQPIF